MNRKILLMLVVCFLCSIYAVAQTDYYYDTYGKKISITLNENKVLIMIPKDCDKVNERICANVQPFFSITDELFGFFYIFITRADFEKLTSQDFWEEDAKSVIITPCYDMENMVGIYREAFLTIYLGVKLKKEEDIDLLNSYAEKYKLKILGRTSRYYPLWYDLQVTQESEKNALECANEMYESGDFERSYPGWALPYSGAAEPTSVRSITTATTKPSSEIYDLQGRRLSATPQKGVYIQNGKKKLGSRGRFQ